MDITEYTDKLKYVFEDPDIEELKYVFEEPDEGDLLDMINLCIEENLIKMLKIILDKYNYIINIRNEDDDSPLDIAIMYHKYDIIHLLLCYNADPCIYDIDGNLLLKYVSDKPDEVNILKYISDKSNEVNILKYISDKPNEVKILKYISDESDEPDEAQLLNIIHTCIQGKMIKMLKIILDNYSYIINIRDKDGDTPLDMAAMYHQFDFIHLLLYYNANPNIHNNEGNILYYAIEYYQGKTDLVKILLNYNVDIYNYEYTKCCKRDKYDRMLYYKYKRDKAAYIDRYDLVRGYSYKYTKCIDEGSLYESSSDNDSSNESSSDNGRFNYKKTHRLSCLEFAAINGYSEILRLMLSKIPLVYIIH
jgi:ankyrin repeat protein